MTTRLKVGQVLYGDLDEAQIQSILRRSMAKAAAERWRAPIPGTEVYGYDRGRFNGRDVAWMTQETQSDA